MKERTIWFCEFDIFGSMMELRFLERESDIYERAN